MNEKALKLKPSTLLICAILFTILQAAGVVIFSVWEYVDISWMASSTLFAVICFIMWASYKSHTKNVMKPAIGAALALVLFGAISDLFSTIQEFDWILESYSPRGAVICELVVYCVEFVAAVGLNIMHYVINSSHKSNYKLVKLNKMFFILFITSILAIILIGLVIYAGVFYMLSFALTTVSDLFMIAMVIAIESALDTFKANREPPADPDEPEAAPAVKSKAGALFGVEIVSVAFIAAGTICSIIEIGPELVSIFKFIVLIACTLGICFSYRSHTKNVMKPLMGATITFLLLLNIDAAFNYIQYFGELVEGYGKAMIYYMILVIVICAIVIGSGILIIMINSTHASSPKKVKALKYLTAANIIAALLVAVATVLLDMEVLLTVDYICLPFGLALQLAIVTVVIEELEKHREAREK